MEDFERPLSPRAISDKTGRTVSEEEIRAACHRGNNNHPLPHKRVGETGKTLKIRWSVFCKWYEEEEKLSIKA